MITYALHGMAVRDQPISTKSIRRLMFCDACQKHFKALEDRVIPILEPMGRGQPLALDEKDRRVLAEWGAKTTYALFGWTRREDRIPEHHRTQVRKEGTPPTGVFVAFGRYTGGTQLFVSTVLARPDNNGAPRVAYNAVAAFGQVIMKVFGVPEPAGHDTFGSR